MYRIRSIVLFRWKFSKKKKIPEGDPLRHIVLTISPSPPPIFLFHSFFFFSPSPLESPTYVFAVRRDAWTRTFRTRGVDTPRHFYVTPSLLAVSECQSPPRLMATRTRPESFSILGPLDCAPISTVPFTHYRPFTDRFTLCLRQRGGEGRGEGGRR